MESLHTKVHALTEVHKRLILVQSLERITATLITPHNLRKEKMTNLLQQVNTEIINDPHGKVARQASHWLAVNVMGLPYVDDPNHFVGYFIPFDMYEKLEGYRGVSECGSGCMMDKEVWQPFIDANHTRMLWVKVCEKCDMPQGELAQCLAINLLFMEPVDCVLAILQDGGCQEYLKITNDTLKGWLENE